MRACGHAPTEAQVGPPSPGRRPPSRRRGESARVRAVDDDGVIQQQITYYRARAAEYDDWWQRRAEYDLGPEFTAAWEADVAELRTWLTNIGPRGHVLELAAGTGAWTAELLLHVDQVTAVDASPEVLALNVSKNGSERVEYLLADVFSWKPPQQYDAVFFAFWASHIPSSMWRAFWELVRGALNPDGLVLFCDNAHPEYAGRYGPSDWPIAAKLRAADDAHGERRQRQLRDGSTHTIVKRYWWPEELSADLASLGWQMTITNTRFAFIYGHGSYAPDR